jgi:hypothetical protein
MGVSISVQLIVLCASGYFREAWGKDQELSGKETECCDWDSATQTAKSRCVETVVDGQGTRTARKRLGIHRDDNEVASGKPGAEGKGIPKGPARRKAEMQTQLSFAVKLKGKIRVNVKRNYHKMN